MNRRQSSPAVLALAALAALTCPPPAAWADAPAGDPDVQPYVGQVTADDVYVRSGPTEGFYATSKLNKGDRVTVVGIRGMEHDYLKIVPPDGSFCYVAKAYVEVQPGSTTAGKVTRPDLIVRAGSTLNGKMSTMLMKLDTGDAVQLMGAEDDSKYVKIAPPPGAYLYIKRSLVSAVPNAPVPMIPLAAQANDRDPIQSDPVLSGAAARPTPAQPPVAVAPPVARPVAPPVAPPPDANVPLVPATPMGGSTPAPAAAPPVVAAPVVAAPVVAAPVVAAPVAAAPVAAAPVPPVAVATPPALQPATAMPVPPTTEPPAGGDAALASARVMTPASTQPAAVALVPTPAATTRPAMAEPTPRQRFDTAEAEFARISVLPLDRQPVEGLLWRYKTLANNAALPASARQTSRARMATLAVRVDAKKQLLAANQSAAETTDRERSLRAEQDELAQRAKDQAVTAYAAVGVLRVSSLQQAGPTLYRLTDPANGRTVIYVRSNDSKFAGLLDQFVGVRGSITQDPAQSLRYVTPTDAEAVDAAKVNHGITAVVTPPSMLSKAGG